MREDKPAAKMRQSAASFGWFVLVRPMSSIILPDQHTQVSIPAIIALVGAGGKTSLLFWLSLYFKKMGLKVLCTTTTAMYRPDPSQYDYLVIHHEFTQLLTVLNQSPKATVTYCATTYATSTNKVKGLSPNDVDRIDAHHIFDVILVEADGAKGLPIKAPDDHEPCLPIRTTIVLAVIGVDAILQSAQPNAIHRWQKFASLTGCQENTMIDEKILQPLIDEPDGLFKNSASENITKILVINKLDVIDSVSSLYALLKKLTGLLKNVRLRKIWLTSVKNNTVQTFNINE